MYVAGSTIEVQGEMNKPPHVQEGRNKGVTRFYDVVVLETEGQGCS